jgi:hypothetical protein
MGYWILNTDANGSAVIDNYPKSKIKNWRYAEGESLLKEFPKKAEVKFSSSWPQKRTLLDFLDTSESSLFVSNRVRDILEGLKAPGLEFLPVTVKDHKGNVASADYFILNPLNTQDAIDMEKSDVVMSSLDEGQIMDVNKLVLAPKKIDKQARLFRASTMRRLILVDEGVRKAFKQEKITGVKLFKAEGWNGLPFGNEEG